MNSILGKCCHQKTDRERRGQWQESVEGTVNETQKPNTDIFELIILIINGS